MPRWVNDRATIERTLMQAEWLLEHAPLPDREKKHLEEAVKHMRPFLSKSRPARRRSGFGADGIRNIDRSYRSLNGDVDREKVQTVTS